MSKSARDHGLNFGVLPTGELNLLNDVKGVSVGHYTLREGEQVRTGVTAILPHAGNLYQEKVPAAIHVGNGFGKLAGYTQVDELGCLETPILLTNTLSVGVGIDALVEHTLKQPGNEQVHSVNAVVGETNDGYLNDIRGQHLDKEHMLAALAAAKTGHFEQGVVGAGTGTVCFGFKGGIGSASRLLPAEYGGYSLGVLVQSNFGGLLTIAGQTLGASVGASLGRQYPRDALNQTADGSLMVVLATDAPISYRNLRRLAGRAMLGVGRTGGICANGSGDYVIAFSSSETMRISKNQVAATEVSDQGMTPLFLAAMEATEEAIINSLFFAETTTGYGGHTVEALPVDRVMSLMIR